ncbi:hypothetical protein, partial [Methylomagnum sp.]
MSTSIQEKRTTLPMRQGSVATEYLTAGDGPPLLLLHGYERLCRMALMPGYLEATLRALMATNTLWQQSESEMLLDRLHRVVQPTLVLWGE